MSENKNSKKLKIGSLAGGLAFGGLSFCGLNDVDADVVAWATPGSVEIGAGAQIDFDIDGDGQNDLRAGNAGGQFLSFGNVSPMRGGDVRTNGPLLDGEYGQQLAAFDTGVGTYVISGANVSDNSFAFFSYDGNLGANFQDSPLTLNFAFNFENANDVDLFGWGTVQYNGPGEAFTVISGFYEDEGNSIIVGETAAAVPEPSSLMLLGLGAAGLAGFRRKRSA